jgi:phosphopantetheinyl transferase (holo-ACP synthase)
VKAEKIGVRKLHLSITHADDSAVAVVVAEG